MNPSGFKEIAIVGLGLMGGSLAAACRKAFPQSTIVAISRSEESLSFALKKKWVHEISTSPLRASRSDLVVLASPLDVFPSVVQKIARNAQKKIVLTDVGSVKGEFLRWCERQRFSNVECVGAHPMVGSHCRGIQAASPTLYKHGLVFLVSTKTASLQTKKKVENFWKILTGKVVWVSAREHDEIVAEVSHVPHAVAACLAKGVRAKSLPFASTGFRDTTRIAQGDPSIWEPIFYSNHEAVLRQLDRFGNTLAELKALIQRRDRKGLARFLGGAKSRLKILTL